MSYTHNMAHFVVRSSLFSLLLFTSMIHHSVSQAAYIASITLICDNSVYLYRSDDDFATYTQLEDGSSGGNSSPATITLNDVTANTKFRIGCWNYGGTGYLQSLLTVDGQSYDLTPETVDTLYKFVGFEKVNDNDAWPYSTSPQPDVSDVAGLDDPQSLITPYDAGSLIAVGTNAYWPSNMVNRIGVIWVDINLADILVERANPGNCLDPLNNNLVGWYTGDSIDVDNNVWIDLSGLPFNDATIGGPDLAGLSVFDGSDTTSEFYLNGRPVVTGGDGTHILFGPTIGTQHTVFNLCKYKNGADRVGRILTGFDQNSVFGHHWGRSGLGHYQNWITMDNIDRFGRDFVLSTQQDGLYRGNGWDLTTNPGNTATAGTRLAINTVVYWLLAYEASDFGCAEIIMVNEELSLDEILCIEDYLTNKYDLPIGKATNNPGQCLNEVTDLVGWYNGDSMDLSNNVWTDISGAGYDGIITGSGIGIDAATNPLNELYLNGNPIVTGSTSTEITFPPILSTEFTVFNLCKYQENGAKDRIIQAEHYNLVAGFNNGAAGVAYVNAWITPNGDYNRFGTNWVSSSLTPSLYHANGNDYSNGASGSPIPSKLTINRGLAPAEGSDFACAEVILVNSILSAAEIECIEDYLSDKYGLKPTANPGGCLDTDSQSSLAGWYDTDSIDLANNVWKDKSGYGYNNNGIITGSGASLESDGEFYLNGENVLAGTTETDIVFNPMLQPQHTVINLCRYQNDGVKGRILQGTIENSVFGFHAGFSGVAYENGWVTNNVDSFGTDWVLSSQTTQPKYRGNKQDLTATTVAAATVPTQIGINKLLFSQQPSDFACSEIILFNQELSNDELLCLEDYLITKYEPNQTPEPTKTPTKAPITASPTTAPTFEPCTNEDAEFNINFILDESGSVNEGAGNENNYRNSVNFVQNLIRNDINSISKISALAFSYHNQDLYRFFEDQTSRDGILNALQTEKSNYVGSTTDTYNAIIRGSEMFSDDGIIEVPDQNFIFLLTDGKPDCANGNDIGCKENLCQVINGISQPTSDGEILINMLSASGIRLYILGIGNFVTLNYRPMIECLTQNDYIFEMTDFTSEQFKEIEEDFRDILCPSTQLPMDSAHVMPINNDIDLLKHDGYDDTAFNNKNKKFNNDNHIVVISDSWFSLLLNIIFVITVSTCSWISFCVLYYFCCSTKQQYSHLQVNKYSNNYDHEV